MPVTYSVSAEKRPPESCYITMIGDLHVLSSIVALLSDIRHCLNNDINGTFTVEVNKYKKGSKLLMTVNNKEIEDWKPQFNTSIN